MYFLIKKPVHDAGFWINVTNRWLLATNDAKKIILSKP